MIARFKVEPGSIDLIPPLYAGEEGGLQIAYEEDGVTRGSFSRQGIEDGKFVVLIDSSPEPIEALKAMAGFEFVEEVQTEN